MVKQASIDIHETVVENLYDGVYYVDRRRTISYWNPAAERITGHAKENVVGRACFDNILGHVDDAGRPLCVEDCPLVEAMAQRRGVETRMFLHHADGHRVPVEIRCQPIRDRDGAIVGAVEIFNEDGTYREALNRIDTLERLSSVDAMTELPNRRTAELSLRARFNDARDAGWPLGLLFVDIDSFKKFNDDHGHAVGDEILRVIGRSLTAALRESDFAARWGGEEFIVLTAARDERQIQTLAERIRSLVSASTVAVEGKGLLHVTVSIGATLIAPADSPQDLVERADTAMYASKADGRNRVTFASASAAPA